MNYAVKEIFYSLQGEGANAGRPAVFCRFAGCNLWSGREADRATAACSFCDTDFVGTNGQGGGHFNLAEELVATITQTWPDPFSDSPLVVCTGGEPLLQLDAALIEALHAADFEIAVETNGTIKAPANIDWLCVSPKVGASLVQDSGDELKLVYPQRGVNPKQFEELRFHHFFLQPMAGPALVDNTQAALRYCLANPRWRLSVQLHKILGIP